MSKRVFVTEVSALSTLPAKAFTVEGVSIILARVQDGFYAVTSKCPHLGLPLSAGKVDGKVITCPFHGSQFDLCSGENLDWVRGVGGLKLPEWSRRLLAMGKKPEALQTYPVSVADGKIYIEL